MLWSILVSAWLVGVLGGVHCATMCGGIITAMTHAKGREQSKIIPIMRAEATSKQAHSLERLSFVRQVGFDVLYHLGRISSYTLLGFLMGQLASLPWLLTHIAPVQQVLLLISGMMLVCLGAALAHWFNSIHWLERAGGSVWRRIQPLTRHVIPRDRAYQYWFSGMLWGWLPCSMVYAVLLTAMARTNGLEGALVMLAFGLGTLPNGLLLSLGGQGLKRLSQQRWLRHGVGMVLVLFGIWHGLRALFLFEMAQSWLTYLPQSLHFCVPWLLGS